MKMGHHEIHLAKTAQCGVLYTVFLEEPPRHTIQEVLSRPMDHSDMRNIDVVLCRTYLCPKTVRGCLSGIFQIGPSLDVLRYQVCEI